MRFVNQDMMIRLALVMCTALQLSGCATTYEEVQKSFLDAPVCCKSKTEFQYEKIRIGGSKEILIEEDVQAFLFDSGKSYFKAFELPSPSQPYHVQVESLVQVNTSFEGFEGYYVFCPTLMTLDQSYNVVRTSDPQTFQLQKMRYGFKLVGQLPFTSKEDGEKYLIILTTGESMNKYTNLRSPFYYPGIEKRAKNSPSGVIILSLTTPSNLNKDNRIKWIDSYKEVINSNSYAGNWFTVLPPQVPHYRFKDLSGTIHERDISHLDFAKYQEGEGARAMVQSGMLGLFYKNLGATDTLSVAIREAEEEHNKNILDIKYKISNINVDGAVCRRIDFSGKSIHMFLLPTKGYDIHCIHPDWSENTHPLVVRIGANYVYPLGKMTETLPNELANFYKGVRFKRTEQ